MFRLINDHLIKLKSPIFLFFHYVDLSASVRCSSFSAYLILVSQLSLGKFFRALQLQRVASKCKTGHIRQTRKMQGTVVCGRSEVNFFFYRLAFSVAVERAGRVFRLRFRIPEDDCATRFDAKAVKGSRQRAASNGERLWKQPKPGICIGRARFRFRRSLRPSEIRAGGNYP